LDMEAEQLASAQCTRAREMKQHLVLALGGGHDSPDLLLSEPTRLGSGNHRQCWIPLARLFVFLLSVPVHHGAKQLPEVGNCLGPQSLAFTVRVLMFSRASRPKYGRRCLANTSGAESRVDSLSWGKRRSIHASATSSNVLGGLRERSRCSGVFRPSSVRSS